MEFARKSALVTGGGSGIGRATAIGLAAAGANVMIMDRDVAGRDDIARHIAAHGGSAATFVGDVADAAYVWRCMDETIARFGGLDLAHNNAGIAGSPAMPLVDCPAENFQKVLDVNLFGIFHCLQAEIRHMLGHGGGAIVNTASVAGSQHRPTCQVTSRRNTR